MRKLSIAIIISLIGIFTISACSKLRDPEELSIPKEYLAYYFYKPNSFWVYKNTTTNKHDTIRVYGTSQSWPIGSSDVRHEKISTQYKTLDFTFEYGLDTRKRKECFTKKW